MSEIAISAQSSGIPVYLVKDIQGQSLPSDLPEQAIRWAKATGFNGLPGTLCLVPDSESGIACALFGMGKNPNGMETGKLARLLPEGDWQFQGEIADSYLSALGFLLGAYRFDRFRKPEKCKTRLILPTELDEARLRADVEAVFLARDLINRPANDLGPAEVEQAVRELAEAHSADVGSVVGDNLLEKNFPMIHAVGRASSQAPRLIELNWGREEHPKVTLVGKGVTFDSGGLNIKPGDSMSLMKKDMGGAANVLGLASLVMTAGLPVRLQVLIGAVENAISGNSFRPGDILNSRKGPTVEIGNTDAEGRLVLADALAFADEQSPQILVDMATLTGAARVALGPDLAAMFTPDDNLASDLADASRRLEDPLWRMPLWSAYRKNLSSNVADISHISKGPFAGAVTAALFLQRFVDKAGSWAHFDIYGWVQNEKPWAPVGGEAFAIRALFDVLSRRYPA